jgi:Uncharacterised nucleotidyltransferase
VDDPALADVLRLCARADHDWVDDPQLRAATARLGDWAALTAAAEAHGLAPLVHVHLTQAGIEVPVDARRQLAAAMLQHRAANRARLLALRDILDAFDRAGIPALVLKGAALAHVLYASEGLRPFGDLDLLVDARSASQAQATLASLGFIAPVRSPNRQLFRHHHLPAALKQSLGYVIQVELHTNAISRDSPGSLSMDRLTSPPQSFAMEGRTAQALGHADMLFHLCRHTAECASWLRLILVADVVGYATRYCDVIPWPDVRRRYPFVPTALSLLHAVTPLPDALLEHVRPARVERLSGVGVSCKPLADIFRRHRRLGDIGRDLFAPSDWWLRLHYGVDETLPLAWQRMVQHPLRVGYWLTRRAATQIQWVLGRR